MERPGGFTPGERSLSDGEIRTLWTGLPQSLARSVQCQRVIMLCLVTAQRLGEVCGMRRSELDFARKLWSLPAVRVKNAHSHTVPLSTLAMSIIREALTDASDEFVFLDERGGPLPASVVTRAVSRARETSEDRPLGRFGIAPFSAHDLRRTALSGLARLGVTPHVIAHVANHRSITKGSVTFATYVQYSYEGEKRAALDLWARELRRIIAAHDNVEAAA